MTLAEFFVSHNDCALIRPGGFMRLYQPLLLRLATHLGFLRARVVGCLVTITQSPGLAALEVS